MIRRSMFDLLQKEINKIKHFQDKTFPSERDNKKQVSKIKHFFQKEIKNIKNSKIKHFLQTDKKHILF